MSGLIDSPGFAAVVQALMNGLWQGLLLTSMIWLLLRLMRRINAATRFAVWWAALIAVVFLPLLGDRLSIATPEAIDAASDYQSITRSSTATAQPTDAPEQLEGLAEGSALSAPALSTSEARDQAQTTSLVIPVRFLNGRWAVILFSLWVLGSLIMLGRVSRSYFHLRRLKRAMSPLPQNYQESLALCRLDKSMRRVEMGASSGITTPVVAGFARPTILIPDSLVGELTESEFDQITLHEMAHIRRGDDWLNLLQKLIEAMLFFNPAVWWIGRQLSLEREIACDDRVVSMTGKSKPYAACLLKLAEIAHVRRITMLAPGAVLTRNQISRRIEMLMDKKRNSTVRLSRAMLLAAIALLALAVVKGTEILPALALDQTTASSITSADQIINDQPAYQPETSEIQDTAKTSEPRYAEVHQSPQSPDAPRQDIKEPKPPSPPSPPQHVPSPPHSLPSPPRFAAVPPVPGYPSEKDQARYEEQRRKYEEQMRQYEKGMEQYRKQMETYDGQMRQYDKEMAEYHKQMNGYDEQMRRYEEEMRRYEEEMRQFEQQIHQMVPLVVSRLIRDEMGKIDADIRDRIDSAVEQVASSIAKDLISKVRDLKINRPGGYIALVSEMTAKDIHARLSDLFRRYDLKLDSKMKAEFDAALGRVSPALQWLVVYKFD